MIRIPFDRQAVKLFSGSGLQFSLSCKTQTTSIIEIATLVVAIAALIVALLALISVRRKEI